MPDEVNSNEEFDLVIPFTQVESVGGRYNDLSFAAGFQIGTIYQHMEDHPNVDSVMVAIYSDLLAQVDLIAMNYKCVTEVIGENDGDMITVKIRKP